MKIKIPVSIGELVDKLTILEIKLSNVSSQDKKVNLENEFNELKSVFENNIPSEKIQKYYQELLVINKKLWKIEDDIRILEKQKLFNEEFIELARSVYVTNDERFEIKNTINSLMGSNIIEEKLYEQYK
tara:strand:- start:1350 stop:1736 length:387 start_codon:yes stop_codon:yes gene_type:complete